MIDINTILTQALTAAVAEATKPLVERIAALEKHTAVLDQHGGILECLDNQEWFWEKVSRYITNNSNITVDELHNIKQRLSDAEDQLSGAGDAVDVLKDRLDKITTASDERIQGMVEQAIDAHLEQANHLDEDYVTSLIEQGVDYHEENRTHGDEDDIEEMVQKLLSNASISISV